MISRKWIQLSYNTRGKLCHRAGQNRVSICQTAIFYESFLSTPGSATHVNLMKQLIFWYSMTWYNYYIALYCIVDWGDRGVVVTAWCVVLVDMSLRPIWSP